MPVPLIALDPTSAAALVIGAALIFTGSMLLRAHRKSWTIQKHDPDLPENDRRFYGSRYRRRVQVAVLLMVIGVMIPVGDLAIPWVAWPMLFPVWWGLVLLLAMWVILLGVVDAFAAVHRAKTGLAEVQAQREYLERELQRIKESRE